VSISSTFYAQLLRSQIPKAQKDRQAVSLFVLFGSARIKAVRKMFVKSTTSGGLRKIQTYEKL